MEQRHQLLWFELQRIGGVGLEASQSIPGLVITDAGNLARLGLETQLYFMVMDSGPNLASTPTAHMQALIN